MIRDLYAHMPTPNYVKHMSPTVSVDVSECSFSDHCLIKTETYIHVDPITIQTKCINPSLTSFEKFDFNRSDWIIIIIIFISYYMYTHSNNI